MADAPWRCSQCGTVNEPAANSCRTCGRWPSLFDLQQSTLDAEPETVEETYEPEPYAAEPAEMPEAAGEVEAPEPTPEPARWPGPEPSIPKRPAGRSMRRLTRLIVPLLILLYVVISAARGR